MLSRITAAVVMVLCTCTTWAATFTVAVVEDGGRPDAAREVAALEAELVEHVREGSEIRVVSDPAFTGSWTQDSAAVALDAALDDPTVDVVLVTGWLGTREAASRESLPKPVVSGFVRCLRFSQWGNRPTRVSSFCGSIGALTWRWQPFERCRLRAELSSPSIPPMRRPRHHRRIWQCTRAAPRPIVSRLSTAMFAA
ncbi:MAG: hypothetical protein IFK91_11070 [Acidobacteria bacterium]|nr:hypothetical protein [Candidatus Sulfomarinibacter sp. MAG AM1]